MRPIRLFFALSVVILLVFTQMSFSADIPQEESICFASESTLIASGDISLTDKEMPILEKRGCCSHHGGVCGCDEATGRQKCCDGTLSPSCRCGE